MVILRSFGVFPIFGNYISRERLFVEYNGLKSGNRWQVFFVYSVLFTVKYLQGQSRVIQCISNFQQLFSGKRLVVEQKGLKFGCMCQISLHTGD